ncbi:MAG: purine-nucleoside phosphorylase [Clostridia bacterium]|nr:purine-nucleoside phosphorylase [Clostridia bacterium]
MSTPHISADKNAFAKTVLMPGDPLRAKFIADNYLKNVKEITSLRNMLGFTGEYNGKEVSVMGSGMGMPSIGIYSYELFNFYGVENIIRIGSAGAIADKVNLRDIVFGMSASTDSDYASQYNLPGKISSCCDFSLLKKGVEIAEKKNINYHVGNILSSDRFYGDDETSLLRWQKMNVLAVEMEAAALYMNAARAGKKALAILTVSDCPLRNESTSAEERQNTFTQMMEIALEI